MRRPGGFTLIEAAIALAILAIGLTAALRGLAMAGESVQGLQDRQLADWVARDQLAELRLASQLPAVGESSGVARQADRLFRWQATVSTTANPLFRRVDLEVFAEDGTTPLAHLAGFAVREPR